MNSIWNLLFLTFITGYSHGRFLAEWSITTDQPLIDECLNKALRHISADHGNAITQSKVTNLVCKTQFINGLHIKLNFDLEQQTWECSFYKSPVQTISIQYEQCNLIETPESSPSADDEEAKIDELSQANRDKNNQQDSEENDDEEGLDNGDATTRENNQQNIEQITDNNVEEDIDDEEALEKESDIVKDSVGENNEQDSNNDDNSEVPRETVNADQVEQQENVNNQ